MDFTKDICSKWCDWCYHMFKFGDPFKVECDCKCCEEWRKKD